MVLVNKHVGAPYKDGYFGFVIAGKIISHTDVDYTAH